jgi:hypothetical protein
MTQLYLHTHAVYDPAVLGEGDAPALLCVILGRGGGVVRHDDQCAWLALRDQELRKEQSFPAWTWGLKCMHDCAWAWLCMDTGLLQL